VEGAVEAYRKSVASGAATGGTSGGNWSAYRLEFLGKGQPPVEE